MTKYQSPQLLLKKAIYCPECRLTFSVSMRYETVILEHAIREGICNREGERHVFKVTEHIPARESGIPLIQILPPKCENCYQLYSGYTIKPCGLRVEFYHFYQRVMEPANKCKTTLILPLAYFHIWI